MNKHSVIPVPPEDSLLSQTPFDADKIFSDREEMDRVIQSIKVASLEHVPDMTTEAGRSDIKSNAFKVVRSKTYLAEVAKAYIAPMDKKIKDTRKTVKHMEQSLDSLRDEIKAPVMEFERKEEARISAIKVKLREIESMAITDETTTASDLQGRIDGLTSMYNEGWDEFEKVAREEREAVLTILNEKLASRIQHEKDQVELAELRRKQKADQEELDRLRAEAKKDEAGEVVKVDFAQEPIEEEGGLLDEAAGKTWSNQEKNLDEPIDYVNHTPVPPKHKPDFVTQVQNAAAYIDIIEASHPDNPLIFSTLRAGLAALVRGGAK